LIQDEDVAVYIQYLIEKDQIKLLCLMDYIKKLLIIHQAEQEYIKGMARIMRL